MYGKLPIADKDISAPIATPCLGEPGVELPTDFGGGVRQAVEGGALACRGFAHEADKRIARHVVCVSGRVMQRLSEVESRESGSQKFKTVLETEGVSFLCDRTSRKFWLGGGAVGLKVYFWLRYLFFWCVPHR